MTVLMLADARARLSRLLESAVTTHERFEITRDGDRVDDVRLVIDVVTVRHRRDAYRR